MLPEWDDEQTNDKQGKIELISQWTMEGWDEQYSQSKYAFTNIMDKRIDTIHLIIEKS